MTNKALFHGQTMLKGVPVIVSDGIYEYDKMAILIPTVNISPDMMEQVIEDCNEDKWIESDEVHLELVGRGWAQIYPAAELCYNDYHENTGDAQYFYQEGQPIEI